MKRFDRISFVGVCFSIIAFVIAFRMIRIQREAIYLVSDPVYQEYILPDRGVIYDRDGHILAGNKLVYEIGIELNQVDKVDGPETIAQTTARILGLNYNLALETASIPFDSQNARYAVLEDFIEPEKIAELSQVKDQYLDSNDTSLNGLYWFPYLTRSYPEGDLASNVLGFFAFWDRKAGKPHFGIEEEYNDLLAGRPKAVTYQLNPGNITELPSIPPGANLVLTIDREIQSMVERILDQEVEDTGAQSGTIIVMQPETGEILAMAVAPRIDPNVYHKYDERLKTNYAFNQAIDINYEPGSVFKVITMAAALDNDSVEPETEYVDTGYYTHGGLTIYNWDMDSYARQDMTGCMQYSLNVCLAWIAVEKLGAGPFYEYLDRFGIGRRTHIDLAGERVYPISLPGDSSWYDADLATNSFGQGLMVSPIQMATAISAVANDGKMMAPHVLKQVISAEQQITIYPRVISNPISAETAQTLTQMLAISLEREASSALVDGYRVAGKTGTGQIAVDGGYNSELTNTSFVGWGPADDPKFLVYVWLEKPTSSKWGSVVAAPIFRKVVTELVILMNLPPDTLREQMAAQ